MKTTLSIYRALAFALGVPLTIVRGRANGSHLWCKCAVERIFAVPVSRRLPAALPSLSLVARQLVGATLPWATAAAGLGICRRVGPHQSPMRAMVLAS